MISESQRNRSPNGKNEMTEEDFRKWLKGFDVDRDGCITVEELREAIKAAGGWFFCTWRAKRGVKKADRNLNGVIDDWEISHLVEFAEKHLGIRIVSSH